MPNCTQPPLPALTCPEHEQAIRSLQAEVARLKEALELARADELKASRLYTDLRRQVGPKPRGIGALKGVRKSMGEDVA